MVNPTVWGWGRPSGSSSSDAALKVPRSFSGSRAPGGGGGDQGVRALCPTCGSRDPHEWGRYIEPAARSLLLIAVLAESADIVILLIAGY